MKKWIVSVFFRKAEKHNQIFPVFIGFVQNAYFFASACVTQETD